MKIQEFINQYFIEMHKNYYSRYDIAEKGFAFQDSSPFSITEVKKEYKKFLTNEKLWIKNYKW